MAMHLPVQQPLRRRSSVALQPPSPPCLSNSPLVRGCRAAPRINRHNTFFEAPTTGTIMPKQRSSTSTQLSPKWSIVGLAVCCNATTSASTPATPILFPASRAHRSRPSAPSAAHIQHLPLQFPHPQSRDPTIDSAKPCPSLSSPFILSTHRAQAWSYR